jgi:chorismate mutase
VIIDSASLEYMHTIRERAAYRDAIAEIKEVLNDPSHGAYHSDLWAMVWDVIINLEKGKK